MRLVALLIPIVGIAACRTTAVESDVSAETINAHIVDVGLINASVVTHTENNEALGQLAERFKSHLEEFNERIKKFGYEEELTTSRCSIGRQISNYFSTTGPFEIRSAENFQEIAEDEENQKKLSVSREIKISSVKFDYPGNTMRMSVATALYIKGMKDFGSPQTGGQGFGEPVKMPSSVVKAAHKLDANSQKEVLWSYFCSGFNKSIAEYGWVDKNGASIGMENRPVVH